MIEKLTPLHKRIIAHLNYLGAEKGTSIFVIRRLESEENQKAMERFLLENPDATVQQIKDKAFELCENP